MIKPIKRILKPVVRPARKAVNACSQLFHLWHGYLYDQKQFRRYSAYNGVPQNDSTLCALFMMDVHRIEKGMSVLQPRLGFGLDAFARLNSYLQSMPLNRQGVFLLHNAISAIRTYIEYHQSSGLPVPWAHELLALLNAKIAGCDDINMVKPTAGVRAYQLREVVSKIDVKVYEDFVLSRSTVRAFSDRPVDPQLVRKVVEISSKTPSVCNRQGWRIHSYSDSSCIQRILSLQNGNRGFGSSVRLLFIVTYETSCFNSVGERNQGWVDAGMFSMSLVNALHANGLGSCCLNWCAGPEQDRSLIRHAGLPASERAVMMIAVGHLLERCHVAVSPRYPVDSILTLH